MASKFKIGTLIITLLLAGAITVELSNEVRIKIDNDKTVLYAYADGKWITAATEYSKLYNGTKQVYRNIVGIAISHIQEGNIFKGIRTTPYQNGATVTETYFFDATKAARADVPVGHKIEVFNGNGLTYQYEARGLNYTGLAMNLNGTSFSAGIVRVAWQPGNYYARVSSAGTLTLKYRVEHAYKAFDILLTDPPPVLTLNGVAGEQWYEYGTNATINCTTAGGTANINVSCWGTVKAGTGTNTIMNWTADSMECYMADRNVSRKFTGNSTFNITFMKPLAISGASLTLEGGMNTVLPSGIMVYFNGSQFISVPDPLNGTVMNTTKLYNGLSQQNITVNNTNSTYATISPLLDYTFANMTVSSYSTTLEQDAEISGTGYCTTATGTGISDCGKAMDENWTLTSLPYPDYDVGSAAEINLNYYNYPTVSSGYAYEDFAVNAISSVNISYTGQFDICANGNYGVHMNCRANVTAWNFTAGAWMQIATDYWQTSASGCVGRNFYYTLTNDKYADFVSAGVFKIRTYMAPDGFAGAPTATTFTRFLYVEAKINYTGYPDFAIDYGHDGRWDWNTSALSSETSLALNLTDINAYACGANVTCAYPIYIYSQSGRQPILVRNISLLANTSNIPLNYTPIQLYANQNGNLTSASTPWKINATWGNVTVRDISITYAGSQDYTVTCYNSTSSTSYPMHVAYSNISVGFPGNVRFYTFAATNATQLNLTPWGQTLAQSSMNITTANPWLNENVSIYFNSTLPACMNVTFAISGNKNNGVRMNLYNSSARWVPITNSSYGNVTQFWFWTDMNASCTQTWYDKWFIIEPICYKCVRDW